ncbi:MAG: exo-alpha-sialidase [Acidobacteria bacterium]|nr:exo-alpha-sialidase [Acidobacteriota bacterium]
MLKNKLVIWFATGWWLCVMVAGNYVTAQESQALPERENQVPQAWVDHQLRPFRKLGPLQPPGVFPSVFERWRISPQPQIRAELTSPVRVSQNLVPSDRGSQAETQAEPHLAVNPINPTNLVASYQDSRFANGGAVALTYATSFDGGQTWVESVVPALSRVNGGPWDRASDPWVAFGSDNRVYLVSLVFQERSPENALAVSASTDGGLTWGNPVTVVQSIDDFNDKETITVDTSPASPFRGTVYVTWDANVFGSDGTTIRQELVLSRSTDEGRTWSDPIKIRRKGANVGVIPRVGPDGSLYTVWAGGSIQGNRIWLFFSKSMDGGRTWSKPKKLQEITNRGIAGARTGEFLPSFDVDPTSGELFIGWQDARWTGVDQATIITSRDKGETWTLPRRVSAVTDDAPCFTVSVATSPTGEVAVSYYSFANDPERRFLTDLFLQVSTDGGKTFGAPQQVTPASFDLRFAAQARGFFLGDYIGLAGSSAGFHLLWVGTDLPSAVDNFRRQPDVFFATVP